MISVDLRWWMSSSLGFWIFYGSCYGVSTITALLLLVQSGNGLHYFLKHKDACMFKCKMCLVANIYAYFASIFWTAMPLFDGGHVVVVPYSHSWIPWLLNIWFWLPVLSRLEGKKLDSSELNHAIPRGLFIVVIFF